MTKELDMPIDINAGKLMDWLINRRHCNRNWQSNIIQIRTKISNAIQNMPAHDEIAQLVTGTHINYFHCKRIVNILKETEVDTKNLFGRYGSQRMKDWQEIINLYEKDNLYLAEAAQILIRNINYEVPSFKKQFQKCELVDYELEKKEIELKKSENIVKAEFNNLCKQMGISGTNVKKELLERLVELPDIYENVVKKTKKLDDAIQLYSAFSKLTLGDHYDRDCLAIIKYINEKGNTTTYEWSHGTAPICTVESVTIDDNDVENTNLQNDEIDFGDSEGMIDFGDDFKNQLDSMGIVVEESGHKVSGNAVGSDALTMIDNPMTRNNFIDQLLELEAFLKLRLLELKNSNSTNLMNTSQMQVSSVFQIATVDSIQNMLNNVQSVVSEMFDTRVQHLHHIKHSPNYVDVLTRTIEQKNDILKKIVDMQKMVKVKREEISKQLFALKPMVQLVIKRTREIQKEIEEDISKKYKNRLVKLSGGVNTV